MIPADILDRVFPNPKQRERYVNLSWGASQIDAAWRYFRILGIHPTPHTIEETDYHMHIVKGEKRGASLKAMELFLRPFKAEMEGVYPPSQ